MKVQGQVISSTMAEDARVLFTTHSMVMSRCRGRRFQDAVDFHYLGKARAVRIWDEAMLPGEVVSISTDQLAALRDPLRHSHPALANLIEELERELHRSGGQGTFNWPHLESATGVCLLSAKRGLDQRQASYLNNFYALSGKCVLLRKPHNAAKVINALYSRDAIPDDLAPMVILDASGRVRLTYEQWGKATGGLVRLPSAVRSYRNLTIHLMDRGAGKTAWMKEGDALAREVAQLIDSKPNEEWLVIYHKGVMGGTVPDQIRGFLASSPDRISFVNWGRHQGANAYRHIRNVILAGVSTYAEVDYEMRARSCSDISNEQEIDPSLVQEIKDGEYAHNILQALCRSSVRQGKGSVCGLCDAYIIAPKQSGIRGLLPWIFPGCTVATWRPAQQKRKGRVHEALLFVQMHFEDYPDEPLRFTDLRSALGVSDASNFRKTIRKHPVFIAGLQPLGVEEVSLGNDHHHNALARTRVIFPALEGDCYVAAV